MNPKEAMTKPTDDVSSRYETEDDVRADLARLRQAAEHRNPGALDLLEIYGRYQEFAVVLQQYDRRRHVTGTTTAANTTCET
jgi:hypothetical protein